MANELDHIPRGAPALWWALGCTYVSYQERVRSMTRPLTHIPRWLLLLEMAVCLVPLTWLFVAVLAMTARGAMPLGAGILYGSVALAGPTALVTALRLVLSRASSVGRVATTLLVLLAAWTVVGYSMQVLHNGLPPSAWWQEFVLIALLPAWAVAHLLRINSERLTPPCDPKASH
jgi:hypothetical protein